ncbi:MAG TPA: beta-propeller fold lactonase family protein [Thermomicrobiaceae bacterium]|nr:beta-propeller fold lactonase family protein [Thermomicrobiaceae bacterium]
MPWNSDEIQTIRISRRHVLGGAAASFAALALSAAGGPIAAAAGSANLAEARRSVGYLYVNGNTTGVNTIDGFSRRADGSLNPLPGSPFPVGGAGTGAALASQGALAISSNGRYLLAVDAGSDQVSVARINPDGSVTGVPGSPFPSNGVKPVSITVHHDVVFVANAGDGGANYTGFVLGHDGQLRPLAGSTFEVPDGAGIGLVLFDHSGKHLVGMRVNPSLIDSFIVDSDGHLTAAPGSPFAAEAAGPFGSAFRPGTFPAQLFVSNAHAGPGQGSVSAFEVAHSGILTSLPGSPYPNGETAPCWVALSPDRRYLFAANTGSSSISSFRIAPSGSLSLVESVPLRGGSGLGIFDLGLDPSGRYLYQLEGGVQKVAALTAKGGNLAELSSSPVALPAGSSPGGIVIV